MKLKQINFKTVPILIAIVLGSFLLFLSSTQVPADMFGLFKKYDVHLCPEVHGQITLRGKPMPNLEIIRGLTYGGDSEPLEKTLTDSEGRFSFVEKNIRSRKPGSMFDESSIRQLIDVKYNGKKYFLWATLALGTTPNKALTDRLKKLKCDLATPEMDISFTSIEHPKWKHEVKSICRW